MRTLARKSAGNLEQVYATKQAWLLRWALHLTHNDAALAEDLVQEVFLRLLVSWDSLADRHNIEPLLYSYLKYAYLTEQRRNNRYSLQSLSTVEFDTLFLRKRMSDQADQLDLQNELRRIVAYLLWRKHTAKFASIFLLRFFHGYFPEQIMHICLVSRHAVDLSMRYARKEVKSYLAGGARTSPHSALRSVVCRHTVMPAHAFAEELRCTILTATSQPCPAFGLLQQRYCGGAGRPLECGLLSHLVSCERCLDRINLASGLARMAQRAPGDALGSASQTRSRAARTYARLALPVAAPLDEQPFYLTAQSTSNFRSSNAQALPTEPLYLQSSQAHHPELI